MADNSSDRYVTKFEWKFTKNGNNTSGGYDSDDDYGRSQKKELISGPEFTLKSDNNLKFALYFKFNRQNMSSRSVIGLMLKSKLARPKNLSIKAYLSWNREQYYGGGRNQKAKEYISQTTTFTNESGKWELELSPEDKDILSRVYYSGYNHDITVCCEVTDLNPIQFKSENNPDFTFRKQLWAACANELETDVEFWAKGNDSKTYKIPVHKIVLISQSEVFKTMLTNPQYREAQKGIVEIEDFKLDTVQAFVLWLYLGKNGPFGSFAENLFAMADKYEVKQLKDECAEELAESLTNENLAKRFILAILHDHKALKDYMVGYISQKPTPEVVRFFMSSEWISFVKNHDEEAGRMMKMFEEIM